MSPITELKQEELVGKWIATAEGQIVAQGDSMEEAARKAEDQGYEPDRYVVEKVARPGTFIL